MIEIADTCFLVALEARGAKISASDLLLAVFPLCFYISSSVCVFFIQSPSFKGCQALN